MKAFKLNAVITGIRAKVDRSCGLTLATPELSTEQKAELMNLQGVNLNILVTPLDTEPDAVIEVKSDVKQKTQSQRVRAVIFLLCKQGGELGEFESYYKQKTEKYIDFLKGKIEDQPLEEDLD